MPDSTPPFAGAFVPRIVVPRSIWTETAITTNGHSIPPVHRGAAGSRRQRGEPSADSRAYIGANMGFVPAVMTDAAAVSARNRLEAAAHGELSSGGRRFKDQLCLSL